MDDCMTGMTWFGQGAAAAVAARSAAMGWGVLLFLIHWMYTE